MTTLRGLAGRALARLDALTEELANLCTELAAEKQRQSANRRWVWLFWSERQAASPGLSW
jgi:hypothetical protein